LSRRPVERHVLGGFTRFAVSAAPAGYKVTLLFEWGKKKTKYNELKGSASPSRMQNLGWQ
jgi:hypothetical protein